MPKTLYQQLKIHSRRHGYLMPVDWNEVLTRLLSHPHEAALKMDDDGTLLHCALWHHDDEDNPIPLAVVKAFLDACRDAAFEVDEDGNTPLHLACTRGIRGMSLEIVKVLFKPNPGAVLTISKRNQIPLHDTRNPEVTEFLLDIYPEGVCVTDKNGCLPLHYAASCSRDETSPRILQLLLKTEKRLGTVVGTAGVLLENSCGMTPLMLACKEFREYSALGLVDDRDFNHLWEKVFILACATYVALARRNHNVILDEQNVPLLHALVETKCTPAIILRTLSDNPQLMHIRDYRGRTPLAIAASQHDVCQYTIEALLGTDHFDSRIAGMATKEKRLPLHLAAESGWEFEHLEAIRQAAPAALETRDVPTRMYPFMLAAEGGHSNLNSVYELLRASPNMARGMRRAW